MYLRDLFEEKKPTISFEVFPPKKEYPLDKIFNTIEGLKELDPDFISVTYGAGGTTKDRTVEIASEIRNTHNINTIAHLTCATSDEASLNRVLKDLEDHNIKNILALRGDIPEHIGRETFKSSYNYASDLINHIKEFGDFSIGGACYPEGHLEAKSIEEDIIHLKEKVDLGLDYLITQLFFDNELFYDYKDKLVQKNIDIPIVAGVLPVLSKNQIERIIALSGCSFPKKFNRIIEKYQDDPRALKEAGTMYAVEQVIDLLSWDVEGIHIYTMNKSDTAKRIMNNIGLVRKSLVETQ